MNSFVYYLIGLFIVLFISRLLEERALRHLNTGQKAGLIDLFTKDRKFGYAVVFCLVIAFLIPLQFHLFKPLVVFTLYFIAMISYTAFKNYRTYTKLSTNKYPKVYTREILLIDVFSTIGTTVFLGLMFYKSFVH